jgi:hypothetical protein
MINPFKSKSKAELIEEKAESIVMDLFISKWSYEEIAAIASQIIPKITHRLDERQKEVDLHQLDITNAKNAL